jgi:hypothetical protein
MSDIPANTSKRLQCAFIKANGERCKAWVALNGLCPFHQPGADENRRKGGLNRSTKARADKKLPLRIKTIVVLLEKALVEVYAGRLSCKQGHAMASLGSSIVKAYESGILEERLIALEKRIGDNNAPK